MIKSQLFGANSYFKTLEKVCRTNAKNLSSISDKFYNVMFLSLFLKVSDLMLQK